MNGDSLLKFGKGNAKLDKSILTFSLPSGFTCPGADECKSYAIRQTGKIKDAPGCKFRCFSASEEALYTNVRESRWYNFDLLRKLNYYDTATLIHKSLLGKRFDAVRIHVAGDFWSQDYFDAWLHVATYFLDKTFYFYTKSIPFWLLRKNLLGNGRNPGKLANVVPTASLGSKYDDEIRKNRLRYADVVYSVEEAAKRKMEIDHDDSHAMKHGKNFALLLHGTQPAGTEAAKALQTLKRKGMMGYSRNKDTNKERFALEVTTNA